VRDSQVGPARGFVHQTATHAVRLLLSGLFGATYANTSWHFRTRAVFNTIAELGVDRVMFSAGYPYETMQEAAAWFDAALLSRDDARKIGRDNARRLFTHISRGDREAPRFRSGSKLNFPNGRW